MNDEALAQARAAQDEARAARERRPGSAATAWLEAGVNVKADSVSRAAMMVLSDSRREPPST